MMLSFRQAISHKNGYAFKGINQSIIKRYQSSSSSSSSPSGSPLKVVSNTKKIPAAELNQIQKNNNSHNNNHSNNTKTNSTNNNNNDNDNENNNNSNKILSANMKPQKAKQGFSSLPKVPSTITLKPKDILLDKLFSGYRPITLPIEKKKKNGNNKLSKRNAVVYVEFDDGLEFGEEFEEGLSEFENGNEFYEQQLRLEDNNLTRYRYSNYSFNNLKKTNNNNNKNNNNRKINDYEDEYDEDGLTNSINLLKNSLNTLNESVNHKKNKKLNNNEKIENKLLNSSIDIDKRIGERNSSSGRRRVKILKKDKKD